MSARTFRLGGVSPVPWMTARRILAIAVLVVIAAALLVMIVTTRSLVLVGLLLLVGIAGAAVGMRRSIDGRPWLWSVSDQLRGAIARRARWDDFDPELDSRPFALLSPLSVLEVETAAGPVAVLQYPDAMACVLEVSGGGEGARSDTANRQLQQRIIGLHESLADPRSCVDQIDWITIVRETDPVELRAPVTGRTDLPDAISTSMAQLPTILSEVTQRYRTWVILRYDTDRLFQVFAEPPFTESSGPKAAVAATQKIARELTRKGFEAFAILDPVQLAAVCRAILDPDQHPDDVRGCEDFWSAFPAWESTGRGVAARGALGPWMHATAGMSREDWPLMPVMGRWLQSLLFTTDLGPRVVTAKFRLMPKSQARELARGQLTTAGSVRVQRQKQGIVDGGEALDSEQAAHTVTQEITRLHHAGLIPELRIMVSGQTRHELQQQRETATSILTDRMGAESITWDDSRPGSALVRLLPLAVEVAAR